MDRAGGASGARGFRGCRSVIRAPFLSNSSSAGTSLATSRRYLLCPACRKDSEHPPGVPRALGMGSLVYQRQGGERASPPQAWGGTREQTPMTQPKGQGWGGRHHGSG